MKKFAVIVAGGSGTRMGQAIPKQFLQVGGKPVLIHTLEAFRRSFDDMELVVVLPTLHMETGRSMIDIYFSEDTSIHLTSGGETRFESVRAGVELAPDESIVFVHDAVRCMVTPDLIRRCYETALQQGSAIPVVAVKDSMRRLTVKGSEVVDREVLRAVQTPQTFRSALLKKALQQPYEPSFTDEATVVERYGTAVVLISGEDSNVKITYPSDLLMAEQFFNQQGESFF
jgi:2-C-methyl-D-erythritol 4-phosphate cytidylyltransferase